MSDQTIASGSSTAPPWQNINRPECDNADHHVAATSGVFGLFACHAARVHGLVIRTGVGFVEGRFFCVGGRVAFHVVAPQGKARRESRLAPQGKQRRVL
ncbi:hypothetical protein [Planctomycetes bacterium CA13]|uniref:hypothetical protein n=1 Tax=Novipirellula herctigrandis TaxID=2527986 RepID=UPI0011B5CAA7